MTSNYTLFFLTKLWNVNIVDSFLATENPQAQQAHKEIKASKSTRCKMSTLKKTNFNNNLLNTLNAAYPPLKLLAES